MNDSIAERRPDSDRYAADADGHLALVGPRRDRRWVRLSNFSAKVADTITYPAARPGGRGYRRLLVQAADRAGENRHADISARDLTNIDWVAEQLGANFIVWASAGMRSHLAGAILANSLHSLAAKASDPRPVRPPDGPTPPLPRRPRGATPVVYGQLAPDGYGLILPVRCPKCRIVHHYPYDPGRPIDAGEWLRSDQVHCDDPRGYPAGLILMPDPRHEPYHKLLLEAVRRRAAWRSTIDLNLGGRRLRPRFATAAAEGVGA